MEVAHLENNPIKVVIIFGTRPESIKLAPLIFRLKNNPMFSVIVLNTGQHDELLPQRAGIFDFVPDISLHSMKRGETLVELNERLFHNIMLVLQDILPHFIIIQGDTATAMVAALTAFQLSIPIAHIEAGLRTYDLTSPYPEEGYRRVISSLSTWNFCPSERAANNLSQERVTGQIYITGNTVVDALNAILVELGDTDVNATVGKRVLLTIHRRENVPFLQSIFSAVKEISEWANVEVIMPAHLNPAIVDAKERWLTDSKVKVIPPMDYLPWVALMRTAHLIISDSGGIQEEASIIGIPLLVARQNTERPEVIEGRYAYLAGTDAQQIISLSYSLLQGSISCTKGSPYGHGTASIKIASILEEIFACR